jgi:hypothetical protein
MQRTKFMGVLIAAFVVTAISAVGASSASAVVFTLTTTLCTGGTNVALCYSTTANPETLELIGEQSETVEGGLVVFTINTEPVQKIECESSSGSGTIFQKEPLVAGKKTTLKGFLKYKGCVLVTEPNKKCIAQKENETTELEGTLETETTLALKPASGTTFIEIEYTNNGTEKCPATFLGKHAVTGTQTVEILKASTPEETKKGKAVGKTLKFFSSTAELSQELTLTFTGLSDKVYVSTLS